MSSTAKSAAPAAAAPRVNKYRTAKLLNSTLDWIGLLLTLFFIAMPIVWMAITAFKQQGDVYTLKVIFQPTLDNFRTIFAPPLSFGPLLRNSVIVATATVLVATPLGLMAAYAFSRYQFRGDTALLVWVLTTQFIPPVVIAVPFFNLFRTLGLVDTLTGLVILNLSAALPYAIWMIKGFVDATPMELEEAAMVDGCTEAQMIRRVVVPLVLPGVIVAAVFSFIAAWNEFLFAFIMTRTSAARTLQVGLTTTNTSEGVRWEWMSAGGLLVMVPIFILSLLIRKHFVQGLTMGAVK